MSARTPWRVALVLAVAGLAVWRAACVVAGADIDTDAYAHHMIARAILANPGDLAVHWVWLPLFHYVQVPLVALGGSIEFVRWTNVALSAGLPFVLFVHVRRTARSIDAKVPPDATALLAALFAGACPIAMQMGTTAQPEPLFALLVLGVAITFERRRYGLSAAMLGASVMLRYEAWATMAVIAGILVVEPWWRRRRRLPVESGDSEHRWTVVVIPAALIMIWALLRRPVDGKWFGFLRETHAFAAEAMRTKSPLDRGLLSLMADLVDYPVVVPCRIFGPLVALVPFGVLRTMRQQGTRFALVLLAPLAFISLTWMMRASLGLDRHFVAVVPLYATFAAQGVAVIADWVTRLARPKMPNESTATLPPDQRDERSRLVGCTTAWALGLSSLIGLGVQLESWMNAWRGSIAHGWPERSALGAYLRSLPDAPTIFCDDATLEIISRLDRRRFDRHWVDDPHTWELVDELARSTGVTYVATWRRKLRGHEDAGDIVFRAGFDSADEANTGVAVMRVARDGARFER
ncbi:MAG: hypothetical protein M3O46_01795 [Myxococcota bacterium]|nr:hypothetical protein [Myxococcota bacterium]